MGDTSVLLATTTTNGTNGGSGCGGGDAQLAEIVMAVTGSHVSNSVEDKTEDGDRILGGNRWPLHEVLALLKIRSDMDTTFRDSNLKSPLWEEVSRYHFL